MMDSVTIDKIKTIEKDSDRIINFVFDQCHIYLSTEFEPKYLSPEFGDEYKRYASKLRWEWLYKNYGYVNEINKFSSEFVRINEYVGFQDYPSSIRHKIFIINSLLENNMNTFVPAHVSITPTGINNKSIIGIEELSNNFKRYSVICHPGFTRGIGSTFLNTPLKKVLVYIKKEHNLKLNETVHLKKIKNKKELLSVYESPSTEKELIHDFRIFKGAVKDNVKYHVPGNIPILKVNNIYTKDLTRVHHTNHYKSYTFETFNEYCKILFSNKIKIFTNIGNKDKLINQFHKNATSLQTDVFGIDFKWKDKNYTVRDAHNKADTNGIINPKIAFSHIPDSKYSKAYEAYWKKYRELITKPEKLHYITNDHFMGGSEIIEQNNIDIKELVKTNNYKGVIIYISKDITTKIERLFYELLFCFSYNISITQTKCRNIQIINCSHGYWRNKTKYKEAILNDSILSYE